MPARLARFTLTVVGLLTLLHAYIGWRLLPALVTAPASRVLGIGLLLLSIALIPLGMLARFLFARQMLADRLSWAGSLAMGFFSSLLVFTLIRDAILLLSFLFGGLPQAGVRGSAALVPLAALLVTLIGFVNARRLPRVVTVEIPLSNLPAQLIGFTIVQLSDIHVGSTIKRDYVQAIVDRVNGLDADLVAITGDVVDGQVLDLSSHTEPLGDLRSRYGTFLVTGNHEYYSGAEQWIDEFTRLGIQVLMNRHHVLSHDGARLVIAGVSDYTAHLFDPAQRSDPARALAGSPANVPRVLLAHQPRSANAAAMAGFDLQLSGHTHGGQFWPWPLFVRLQQPYTAGLHRQDKLWIYTSRGTGYWGPPKRFGAPAEITRIRLVPGKGG